MSFAFLLSFVNLPGAAKAESNKNLNLRLFLMILF